MPLNPQLLPDIPALQQRTKALAMLDAIVCPGWELRYYSYDSLWAAGEQMASMRNGQGDDWFILFAPYGAGIKGLGHETGLAWDEQLLAQVRQSVPGTFKSFLEEPAFSWEDMSFCYWRAAQDNAWSRVVHPNPKWKKIADGSTDLLALLHQPASAYVEFAQWYYECELPLQVVEAIYRNEPLTQAMVQALNAELSVEDVADEVAEIGYASEIASPLE